LGCSNKHGQDTILSFSLFLDGVQIITYLFALAECKSFKHFLNIDELAGQQLPLLPLQKRFF
jgi:hypothetical protein